MKTTPEKTAALVTFVTNRVEEFARAHPGIATAVLVDELVHELEKIRKQNVRAVADMDPNIQTGGDYLEKILIPKLEEEGETKAAAVLTDFVAALKSGQMKMTQLSSIPKDVAEKCLKVIEESHGAPGVPIKAFMEVTDNLFPEIQATATAPTYAVRAHPTVGGSN